jgi:L-alanine-DL-glutamate epimerase-like enolase superfamily enzyme
VKITDIRLDRCRLPLDPPFRAAWDPVPRRHVDATVVRVETDEGITGIGSGDTMHGFEAYRDLFLGTDPTRIARQVRVLETVSFHAGRFWPLEAALWDVLGKSLGVPVSALLGNSTDRLPAYMSTGEAKDPAQRVESVLAAREEGFRAVKLRIDPRDPSPGLAAARGVRAAVGDDLTLLVDLNQSWRMAGDVEPAADRTTVARLVRELAELDVFWVEEPLPYSDVEGLAELRRAPGPRVAGGEMLPDLDTTLRLVERDALDVYQMDCVLSLGIHRLRSVADLLLHRNRRFTPHTWTNGIGLLANLHLAAGVGAGPFLEFPYDPDGWTPARRDFMLAEPVRVDPDGCLRVPDTPGLGVVLDEDAIERTRRP